MRVGLHFPFRGTNESRTSIFNAVKPIVGRMYPFENIEALDSGHDSFNRAASRNDAVELALDLNLDVVVVCDADSIPSKAELVVAIVSAAYEDRIIVPFDRIHNISGSEFVKRPHKYDKQRILSSYGPSFGGIYVCNPRIWVEVGGQDERVRGWGFEDQIFLSAANTFTDGPIYIPGGMRTATHPKDDMGLAPEFNKELVRSYHEAERDIDEFRSLQKGSNYFCPDSGSPQSSKTVRW